MSIYNRIPHRQDGMTLISWVVVLAIAIFFVLIGVKMIPTYLENYSIKEVLASVAQDRASRTLSHRRLKDNILKRLSINGVYNFPRDKIKITKDKRGMRIEIKYEVRKPVIGNVSVVMAFDDQAEVRQ